MSASDEEDHQQATDVEEDSQSYILHQIQPELQKQPEIVLDSHMQPVAETTPIDIIVTADDDDNDDEKAEDTTDDKPFHIDAENKMSMGGLPLIGGHDEDIGILAELPCSAAAAIAQMTSTVLKTDADKSDSLDHIGYNLGQKEDPITKVQDDDSTKETDDNDDKPDDNDVINDEEEIIVSEEEEASSKVIKIADLYVKLEHNGSGSTISDEGWCKSIASY